jgi:nucleoid-associated protein YgaU
MAKKRKSILDRAIDAVTTRDEEEEAEAAKKEAEAAKRQAALEAAKREAAEAKARAAEAKAKKAEEAAAEAKAKVEAAKRKAHMLAAQERAEKARERAEKARELAAAKKRVYVVQPGDSLSKIAKAELGDASRWPEIFELNKDQIKDPNVIHPGQELKMPS